MSSSALQAEVKEQRRTQMLLYKVSLKASAWFLCITINNNVSTIYCSIEIIFNLLLFYQKDRFRFEILVTLLWKSRTITKQTYKIWFHSRAPHKNHI